MIFNFIINFVLQVLTILFSWLPPVTVLPLGIEPFLVAGVGGVRFIATVFPPVGILITGFMWVIGWKTSLLGIRLIPIIRHAFLRSY